MIVVTAGRKYLDIDAYGSIVAYTELLKLQGKEAIAVSTAIMNESITQTARAITTDLSTEYAVRPGDQFVVIDVSEPELLDKIVRLESVIGVIDHHLGNEAYWETAKIEDVDIEFIGAACTQVYERWVCAGMLHKMSKSSAQLLSLGILDNTLNFKASVTTQRDVAAYVALINIADVASTWAEDYFSECQSRIERDVSRSVENDTKQMNFPGYKDEVQVGQVVVWDATNLIVRVRGLIQADCHFVNVISISEGCNYILVKDSKLQDFLNSILHTNSTGDVIKTNQLWLRKEIMKAAIEHTTSSMVHNKLVRDKIPQIIEADTQQPVTRILDDQEYQLELRKKLVEEANELKESHGDLDEYADVLEVFQAAIEADGYTWEEVEAARISKAARRGRFEEKIFLEKVIVNPGKTT